MSRPALDSTLALRHMALPNRIIRSATFEGMADLQGRPPPEQAALYRKLLEAGVGTIITGFMYISQEARAVQPGQCGMCTPMQVAAWQELLGPLRRDFPEARFVVQLAHPGRQTLARITGQPAVGASRKRCPFFAEPVQRLSEGGVAERAIEFGESAACAAEAGFDAIQLHAAHGYLIHQFLSPVTNRRKDVWGDHTAFLRTCVEAVNDRCHDDMPIWVKLSHGEDERGGIGLADCRKTVAMLDELEVDLVEVSYGTMAWPMNIFRGDCPPAVAARTSPVLRDMWPLQRALWIATRGRRMLKGLIPFEPCYNADAAAVLQEDAELTVVPVGGIHSAKDAAHCLDELSLSAISLCRPLVHNPAFASKLLAGEQVASGCIRCNLCALHTDTDKPLHCFIEPWRDRDHSPAQLARDASASS